MDPSVEARARGWQRALLEHNRGRVLTGADPVDDARTADWIYLLAPVRPGPALLVGGDWGAICAALRGRYSAIDVVDPDPTRRAFLEVRSQQSGWDTVRVFSPDELERICSARPRHYQLTALLEPGSLPVPFSRLTRIFRASLAPGAESFWLLSNRWAFQHLLRRRLKREGAAAALPTYLRALRREGFTEPRAYVRVPGLDRPPMFLIPATQPGPMDHFLHALFPLLDAVSPEVKASFARELAIARLAVRAAVPLRLGRLAGLFAPAFALLARAGEPSHAP